MKMSIERYPIKKLLIRSTNWIGDAVMTLPALRAIRKGFPDAEITILAKEWVAEILRICPNLDRVLIFDDKGRHKGFRGKLTLAKELRQEGFDAAILLQNAISAAIITWLAKIPVRAGYNTDGRTLLLTHPVKLHRGIKKLHQTHYYLEMVKGLGCPAVDNTTSLNLPKAYGAIADELLVKYGIESTSDNILIGIAPGAAYGPAKRWLPERFAQLASLLDKKFGATILLFGSNSDKPITGAIAQMSNVPSVDLAGKTSLREAIALMSRCRLFISNDSGLMHIAGALNMPLVAIFGSTNHITTAPLGSHSTIVRHQVSCSPCLRPQCPTDFRCMKLITVADVFAAACRVMEQAR